MGDVARCSIGQPNDYHNEELLYKLFGINAELLIDMPGLEPALLQKSNPIKRKTTVSVPGRYFNVLINSRKQELSSGKWLR